MQEIEAKFHVSDLEKVRMRLRQLEAHLIQERVLETNIRFDLPDHRFRSEGRVLRLRQDTETRLTYKGPGVNDKGVLNRTEIEFSVGDHNKARLFLEALGYQISFYYEKYRTTYELAGCYIMLDELPYGNFVEIEGDSPETIRTTAETMALNWERIMPASYHMLFTRICSKNAKLDPTDLSFKALHGLTVSWDELGVHAADQWS